MKKSASNNAKPWSLQELDLLHGKFYRLIILALLRLCKIIKKLRWLLHPVTNLAELVSLKVFHEQGCGKG